MKRYQQKIKKRASLIHPATKLFCLVFALIGIAIGACLSQDAFREDRFLLKGETRFSLEVGDDYRYTEQGVEAVCFGRDVSDALRVETSLEKDAEGNYIIPTDKEGVYTITYTVDAFKFGEDAPNGVIKRMRVFTVSASEEDGRYGE